MGFFVGCQYRSRRAVSKMGTMSPAYFCFLAAAMTMASADLGEILYFNVTGSTDTYIDLEWGIGPSDMTVGKYTLVVDAFLSNDVPCPNPVCSYRVQYLSACSVHNFDITPHYLIDGVDTPVSTVSTTGNTEFALPEAPKDLVAVEGSMDCCMNVTWSPPANKDCVGAYKVCYRLEGTENTYCNTTVDTEIVISGLELCSVYQFTVVGLTPDGDEGPSVQIDKKSANGMPGPVLNCNVTLAEAEMVKISWDTPVENPRCIERYSIEFGETHNSLKTIDYYPEDFETLDDYEHHATVSDLSGCTNYTFEVFAVAVSDDFGEKVIRYAETEESMPLNIDDVRLSTNSDGDIVVEWISNENDNCAFEYTLCYHDEVHPTETCITVPGGGGGGGGGGDGGHNNYTLQQLEPCTVYDIGIAGLTPGGMQGNLTYNATISGDKAPSPVQNLAIDSVDVHQVQISYDEPANYAQCVREYDIAVTDLDGFGKKEQHPVPTIDNIFTDLLACTNYKISVAAVSPSGLTSQSKSVTTVTGEDTPSEPQNFQLELASCNSLSLIWYQPTDNKRCAQQYQLTWTDTNGANTRITNSTSFQVKDTVMDLAGDTSFDFTLVALTPLGTSSTSATLTAATECGSA